MSRGVQVRVLALLIASLILFAGAACHDVVDAPPVTCNEIPADSLRWAIQENPACSAAGKIAYEDQGLIAGCPDPYGFSYFVEEAYAGLWILDTQSQERWKVASGGMYPSWSPDGSRIVVSGLYVVSLVDSSITLIPGEGNRWDPAWSPDGASIAYDEGGYGRSIHVVNVDGSDLREFETDPADWARMPSWSPNGTQIVHVRQTSVPDFGQDIYVVASDGSALRRLTHDRREKWDPSYSPDGRMIAFSAPGSVSTRPQIWIMTADGKNLRELTTTGGFHPTWSPDSRRVIFGSPLRSHSCEHRDRGTLWSIDVATGDQVQLTAPWPQQPELCSRPGRTAAFVRWASPNRPLQPTAPHGGS
jgi:hypothetical protein